MDPRFPVTRDELYTLQMDLKQIQLVQSNQAERLARLERRQEQDANLKSVWQQHPFPSVLAGTPSQGPTHVSSADLYDMDDQENLLSSLHLGTAEEEPARRGAASRANSVRFDESALRQSDWASQSNRHSGEFAPSRPSSEMLMERSLSHKSDGRHSSAGHSVHSVHSLASGRASSLGMHTENFMVGSHDDDSSVDVPEPPPGLFVLGPVPTIIRCWLTTHFAHHTIQYADLCTGSQKSLVDYALIRDLGLIEEVERDMDGACKIRMPVYLVEATVAERGHRPIAAGHQIPSITATFEVTGMDLADAGEGRKRIQIFIGSDTLRAHMADVLLSQNRVSLIGNDREKLSIPFVRPEDEASFRHICTSNIVPDRPRLNANATPFVLGETSGPQTSSSQDMGETQASLEEAVAQGLPSPTDDGAAGPAKAAAVSFVHGAGKEDGKTSKEADGVDANTKETSSSASVAGSLEGGRRESSSGIWGSWRQSSGSTGGADSGQRENGPLSGYQPAGRGGRNMKVLKPLKSGASSARTGSSYEPAPAPAQAPTSRSNGEQRRKSQVGIGSGTNVNATTGSDSGSSGGGLRWDSRRLVSGSAAASQANSSKEVRGTGSNTSTINNGISNDNNHNNSGGSTSGGSNGATKGSLPRTANNPIGGASAFSWMNPAGKPKPTATVE